MKLIHSQAFGLAILVLAIIIAGYHSDHASCIRSNGTHPNANLRGSSQVAFDLKAADARDATAVQEEKTAPKLAAIDRETARQYRFFASQVLSYEDYDCGLPWPSTHAAHGHSLPPLVAPKPPSRKDSQ